MRSESRDLNCKLTPEELDQRRQELVRASSARQDREREKKHVTTRAAAALKEAEDRVSSLTKVCETGEEVRPVPCEWRPDFLSGVRRLVRTDTNEEVDVRTLTESERQQQLELDEAAAKRGEMPDDEVPGLSDDGEVAPFDAPDDEAAEDEEPDESFVEGADIFEKNGVTRVSPDAGDDFGAAVSEATK